ncbi:6-phospho-3-hexuloisomerase [Lactobacillaceae bacterium Scapto_B20]
MNNLDSNTTAWQTILSELNTSPVPVNEASLRMIHDAKHIFVAGAGRSGLAIQAFAMRLTQLGKSVSVVGETTAPAFTADDLLIVASGSATTQSIVSLAETSKQIGGQVWLLTATADTQLSNAVDHTTLLPGKGKFTTGQNTVQPMGSLFEQSVWLYGDAVTLQYMHQYAISERQMQANHANLE